MTLGGSAGDTRRRYDAPQLITALAIVGIIVIALVAGVRRGYLTATTLIYILVAIPSIMFHEVSHGVVALWCGDDTAKRAGRISANPIRHVDIVGTILLPIILALAHGPILGWAKPVPVSIGRLRHPRNQAVLVGLAGPASNYLLAAIAGLALHFAVASHQLASGYYVVPGTLPVSGGFWYWLTHVLALLGLVNVFIGTFNLLPIPPLDGSALVERLLPVSALPTYYRMRMGFMVLVFAFVWLDQGLLSSIYDHVLSWYFSIFL